MQAVETYENSVLVNEKVCIAAKFFDCYQVDLADIEKNHPLYQMVKRPKKLTFYTICNGELLYGSPIKPSVSKLYSLCSKTLKKTHSVHLDRIVKEEGKILDELDMITSEKNKIDQTRLDKGKNLSRKEDLDFQKKEKELLKKEKELKEMERKLLDLDEYLEKKETAAGS